MFFTINIIKKREDVFIIAPRGAMDTSTYQIFQEKIKPVLEIPRDVIILNMEGVTYISSMGLSAVLKAKKKVEEGGGIFMITDLQPNIKKVFEVIEELPGLNVFMNIEEADAFLDRLQRGED